MYGWCIRPLLLRFDPGPGLVKKINQGLCQLLERDGFAPISVAVAVDKNRETVHA
jgi:hypothetical protein